MSGGPTKEHVEQFRIVMNNMTLAAERCRTLITGISQYQKELKLQEEEYVRAKNRVLFLMGEMNLQSPNNMGWESRMASFWLMLNRDGEGEFQ